MTVCAPCLAKEYDPMSNRKPSRGTYQAPPRKRHDHRTYPLGGELGYYLLHGYLDDARPNYHPDGLAYTMEDPYETARHPDGPFVFLEGGKPKMKDGAINQLDGYAWGAVDIAIEMVRRKDPLAYAALRWHQLPAVVRPSRYAWADANHCSHQTLTDRFRSAVRQVAAALHYARRVYEGHEPWEWEQGSGVYERRAPRG